MSRLILITLAAIVPALLPAQTIRGLVTGQTQPSASVTITSEQTGRRRAATASANGRFTFAAVAAGQYTLTAEAPGFAVATRRIVLQVDEQLSVDLALVRAGESQSVEVRAAVSALRTESAALGGVILNQQVTDLPLDGRNFAELSLLLPGVLPSAQGSAASVRGDLAIHVNGAREDSNLFLLDGVYNGDPKLNGASVTPPVDGIREFEIAASNYDSSFGRNAGGQVNAATRSGGNAWHGAAYEFFRNSRLDARNFFSPAGEPDPRYQRNQFGGALGGAIRRDKTFVFGDYEGRRVREGFPLATTVPTAAEKSGQFASIIADPFTGQPLPGNRIPAAWQHPTGAAIAALYPSPNQAGRLNHISSPIGRDRQDTADFRTDHYLTPSQELSARYSFTDRTLFEPFTGPSFAQVPGYGDIVNRRAQNIMLAHAWIISPSLVHEARLAFNRVAIGVEQENAGVSINRQVGLPEISPLARDHGLSFISLLGFTPIGHEYNNPQATAANTWQLISQFSHSRGNAVWRFGGDIRRMEQRGFRDVQSRGFLNFIGFTGNSMADLLLGLPAFTGGAKLDNEQFLRGESYSLFTSGLIKLRPSLTLTLGLRYEVNSPPVDPRNRASLYDPSTGLVAAVGASGLPRAGYAADRNNLAPRAGFSWAPGSAKTVVRGGYGIYYDQPALAPSEGLFFNAPYFDLRFYYSIPGLPLTLSNPFPSFFPVPSTPSAFAFDRALRTPYVQQWNLQVQRDLGFAVLEAGYVGTKGTRLIAGRDFNQAPPSVSPFPMRPNPRFDDITMLESRSNSSYHSLQLSLRRQLRKGVALLASHTYGKSIDDASGFFSSLGDPNFPQDSTNVAAERARSGFDIRHRFTAGYSWLLPYDGGSWAWLCRGWSTHGIWTFQTGRPFTVALPQELDNSGTGRSNLGFGANDRPNVVGPARLDNPTVDRWFNTGAFSVPLKGTFGNAGRNILDGPGLGSVNFSLMRTFQPVEQMRLQFRAEAFNALNRANFDLPRAFMLGPGFGSITSARNPRLVQLGVKLLF